MVRAILLLLLSTCASPAEGAAPLRVLTYNVLYGFNHGKAQDPGARWIAAQEPDIVALQELNRFKQDSLETIAAKWGHRHAVILKEKGFPVGLTANAPIEIIAKRLEGMHHGFLHCKVRGVHVFVVHLSPSKHTVRTREAATIGAIVKSLLGAGEPVLVLGDFNCNSPLDRRWLEARPAPDPDDGKAEKRAANADPDYAVMTAFLDLPLVDVVHAKQPEDELRMGTFPTRLLPQWKTDEQRRHMTWRIDFILADAALAKRCIRALIPRGPTVHEISDHFPVIAEFE